jgi:hypothetical protein
MQLQIWIAGMQMGVDMKTRAQRIKKRPGKPASAATKKNKLQRVA